MVTLPQKDAIAMLPGLLDEAKVESAFAKLNGMITAGTAQLGQQAGRKDSKQTKGSCRIDRGNALPN
jgi:hypothetical protein